MKRVLPYIVFITLLLVASVALCQSVVLWGFSHHLDSPPEGRAWTETNPGIGLRKEVGIYAGFETYLEASVIAHNSTDGTMLIAGGGVQYPFFTRNDFALLMGVAAGGVLYRNSWTNETHLLPGGYPYIGIRKDKVTVNVGYVSRIGSNPVQVYETLFANLVIRLK